MYSILIISLIDNFTLLTAKAGNEMSEEHRPGQDLGSKSSPVSDSKWLTSSCARPLPDDSTTIPSTLPSESSLAYSPSTSTPSSSEASYLDESCLSGQRDLMTSLSSDDTEDLLLLGCKNDWMWCWENFILPLYGSIKNRYII